MGSVPRKWIKRIALLLGIAGMITPALLELGWIPREHALEALIFLLGFLVVDVGSRDSNEDVPAPEFLTTSEDLMHALTGMLNETKHEIMTIVPLNDILIDQVARFVDRMLAVVRREQQLHVYILVVGRLAESKEESFERRFQIERDPSLQGRYRFRFVDSPVSFGCFVYDHSWALTFPPNFADSRAGAIVFKNSPEVARLVASFIRHQWLERPDVTMSLSDAYEKWKAMRGPEVAAN